MHIETEYHGEMCCHIEVDMAANDYIGILKYRIFDVGRVSGPTLSAVRAQFQAICKMVDAGGMVRHGIIMLGYHNRVFGGDVLRVDGEIIGEWASDELEWCHFTAVDATEVTRSAPSPWMLHDSIANWISGDGRATED